MSHVETNALGVPEEHIAVAEKRIRGCLPPWQGRRRERGAAA